MTLTTLAGSHWPSYTWTLGVWSGGNSSVYMFTYTRPTFGINSISSNPKLNISHTLHTLPIQLVNISLFFRRKVTLESQISYSRYVRQ